nr:ATP-binding protein [uncultured Carboxylicivirga sp.]
MQKLRILFAEDVSTDREMVERLLIQNDIEFVSECTENETDFTSLLKNFEPSIILSDYRMPTFDGMKALKIVQAINPQLPFIILTGSMNEDIAVECMKNGADDYVIKQNLKRLIPSIKSAIEKKRLQKAEEQSIIQLRKSELKYRLLIENTPDGVFLATSKKFTYVNEKFREIFEYTLNELNDLDITLSSLVTQSYTDLLAKKDINLKNDNQRMEVIFVDIISKNGNIRFCEFTFIAYKHEGTMLYQGIVKDLSLQNKLLLRNSMLSLAIEQSPVGVLITDEVGTITYTNRAFLQQRACEYDDLIGSKLEILNPIYKDDDYVKNIWTTVTSGNTWRGEIINHKKDGESLPENVSISPVYNSKNELIHTVAIMEDVSEFKNAITELEIAKNKAEESDRLKSAFLANVSHEIRTPMNAILGFTNLLMIPEIAKEKLAEYIEIIQNSGQRMISTINDIIDISRIESGNVFIKKKETNINDLIIELYSLHKSLSDKKNISLDISIPDNEMGTIFTDPAKLHGILNNLMSNAIKFTSKGFVRIAYNKLDDHLLFTVEDSGIGIPQHLHEVIFNRFVQGELGHTKTFEGSGLGLSIAKSYAKILEGKLWFESKPGVGTKFFFSLPIPNKKHNLETEIGIKSKTDISQN